MPIRGGCSSKMATALLHANAPAEALELCAVQRLHGEVMDVVRQCPAAAVADFVRVHFVGLPLEVRRRLVDTAAIGVMAPCGEATMLSLSDWCC